MADASTHNWTPREHAIVELSKGKGAAFVSRITGLSTSGLMSIVEQLGPDGISKAAGAIRRGDRSYRVSPGIYGDDLECGGCSCHLGNSAPCDHCTDGHTPDHTEEDPMPVPRQAEPVEPPEEPSRIIDEARGAVTLTMPLGRLVDADGSETVIAEAVIEVTLGLPRVVLAALRDEGECPVYWTARRRLTPEGAAAIRSLAGLLDDGDA